jgi:hypothetical protein
MKHIIDLPDGGWDYEPYFEYLKTVRNKLPKTAWDFATDFHNYDLTSHQSLHDAWLNSFFISEVATGERSQIRSIRIDSCYLGSYHDYKIHLTYFEVSAYKCISPTRDASAASDAMIGHGDLMTHEVRLEDDGLLTHELKFSQGAVLLITCKNLEHSLEAVAPK